MLRDIRLTRSLLLYDMANDLGMSSAELSAIETGKKPVPAWLFRKLEELYGIGEFYSRLLQAAAEERKHHINRARKLLNNGLMFSQIAENIADFEGINESTVRRALKAGLIHRAPPKLRSEKNA